MPNPPRRAFAPAVSSATAKATTSRGRDGAAAEASPSSRPIAPAVSSAAAAATAPRSVRVARRSAIRLPTPRRIFWRRGDGGGGGKPRRWARTRPARRARRRRWRRSRWKRTRDTYHQREPRGTNDAGDDFDVDALVAAARAKTSANRAEASRSEARASPDRHEPTTLIVAVDSAVQTEDASLTEDASPTEDASLTPSRARRSLEFETETVAIAEAIAEANAETEAETAPRRDDGSVGDALGDAEIWDGDEGIRRGEATATSTPASSAPATPSGSPPRSENTSPEGNRPDISDILGDTVGGLLFGESPADANAMTRVLAGGMPPRPPRPPRSPTRATVPSGMISPPPSPETNANASVVERQSSAKGAAGRAGRPPLVPPRKPDANFAHADADAHVRSRGSRGSFADRDGRRGGSFASPRGVRRETRRRGGVVVGFRLRFRGCVGRGGCGGGGGRGG